MAGSADFNAGMEVRPGRGPRGVARRDAHAALPRREISAIGQEQDANENA